MTETIDYVYCVVAASFDVTDAPRGLDRVAVRRVAAADLAAIVSSVDASAYSGDAPSQSMQNPEWLAPRAVTHDAVVTWVADRGPVVPFPMWVMFSDDAGVSAMLERRSAELRRTLEHVSGAREFSVRVSADAGAVAAAAQTTDPRLGEIERQASVATPGQAYLLQRKLAETRKIAERDAAARIAEQTHAALSGRSRASVARATAVAGEQSVLLDAAYLVENDKYDAFREELTEVVGIYQPSGVRFDFTGPWPPYHFVRDD